MMIRPLSALLPALFAVLSACDLSQLKEEETPPADSIAPPPDVGDVTQQDANTGIGEEPPVIPNSNDALVQQMYLQALNCGYLTKSTVPPGWTNVMVTTSGCSAWKPANWPNGGQPDAFQILESNAGLAGWFVTTGMAQGTTWTLQSATDSAYQSIGQSYGNVPKQHYIKEYEIFGIKVADVVFSFNNGTQPSAAFMRVYLTDPNWILGTTSMTFVGFFMAQAQMSVHMCTLMQIDASLQCPGGGGGGGCSDSECDSNCKEEGYSGGQCSGDDCSCY